MTRSATEFSAGETAPGLLGGAKVVLAFGDSLTWGTNPSNGHRHRLEDRWTTVLAAVLAGRASIVVEGQRGRTSVFDDPSGEADRNGIRVLPVLLASHYPLDLVIIMLGGNDLKQHISGDAAAVAAGIDSLVAFVQNFVFLSTAPTPQVLLVSPPQFRRRADGAMLAGNRALNGEGDRLRFLLETVAAERRCFFTDSAMACAASDVDGVHLDAEGNERLGRHLADAVSRILWPSDTAVTPGTGEWPTPPPGSSLPISTT